MPGILRLLTGVLFAVVLSGATCQRREAPPEPGVAVRPEPVIVERRVYVPIPSALTRREPVAEGPIAMCFDVAAQRRAALDRVNARLEQIEAVQGTEVRP